MASEMARPMVMAVPMSAVERSTMWMPVTCHAPNVRNRPHAWR